MQADTLDCTQLGVVADKAWLFRTTKRSHVLAAVPAEQQPDDLCDNVAALRLNKAKTKHVPIKSRSKEPRGNRQQREGQQQDKPKDLCWNHYKYGGDAHFCRQPKTCVLASKVSGNMDGQDW